MISTHLGGPTLTDRKAPKRGLGSPLIRPPPVRLQERTCWQALYQASPPRFSAQEKRARGRSRCGSAGRERFWSETLGSSLNFVNAAGLRSQDTAFVGLSNFPSFDRNHAGEELGKLRFGFL